MKRIVCAALAFVLLFSSVNLAVFAAGMQSLVLKYDEVDEGTVDVKSILTGGNANVWVSPVGAYTPGKPALRANVKTGIVEGSDMSIIGVAPWGTGQKISIPEKFGDYFTNDKEATLSIMGNYTALVKQGYVTEYAGTPQGQLNDVTINRAVAVAGADNKIVLGSTSDEVWGSPPGFSVSGGTGVFQGYTSVSVRNYTQNTGSSSTGLPNKTVTVMFTGKPNNPDGSSSDNLQSSEFTMTVKQTYGVPKLDENGNPVLDGNGNPVYDSWNNLMKRGTRLEVSLVGPTSNELLLNVLTPEAALENIAKDIELEKTDSSKYVKLAAGDDGDYITTPFELCNRLYRYGEKYFDILWDWKPNNAADQNVVQISQGSGENWAKAALVRQTEDVYGSLMATVWYRRNKDGELFSRTVAVPVKIYGTGVPAKLQQHSQTIGASGDITFAGNDRVVPDLKWMDVYDGSVSILPQPKYPHDYRLQLFMGTFNAASVYAKVEVMGGDPEILEMSTLAGNAGVNYDAYKPGEEIKNQSDIPGIEGLAFLRLVPKSTGTVSFKVVYYVMSGKDKKIVPASVQPRPITIRVEDTSPESNADLRSITIKRNTTDGTKESIGTDLFDFKPETNEYSFSVDYNTESVVITPTVAGSYAEKALKFAVTRTEDGQTPVAEEFEQTSGLPTDPIILQENATTKIQITVTAENPNIQKTYSINIRREPPSADSSLKSLNFFDEAGKDWLPNFLPTNFKYDIEIPFSAKLLRVKAEKNHKNAEDPKFEPKLEYKGLPGIGKAEWFKFGAFDNDHPENNTYRMTTTILPENKKEVDLSTYIVNITRLDPSEIADLASLALTDKKDVAVTYTPAFNKDMKEYDVSIPFSVDSLKITAKPESDVATMVVMDLKSGKKLCDLTPGKASIPLKIPEMSDAAPFYDLQILVTAEDGFTNKGYVLHVARTPPSDDAALKSLVLAGGEGIVIEDYGFNPEVLSYSIPLPYEADKVTLTPTSNFEFTDSITINGKRVASGVTSSPISINYPGQNRVEVVVTAEDGKAKRTYVLVFTREAPSSDARLKALEVGSATDFKPIFVPSKTEYTAKVAEGAKGITVTPTANHAKATITVDGKKHASGTATEMINILEVEQTVTIVVTAQDGRTQLTYKIRIINENLIEKSSNADLRKLEVNFGSMTPKFKPSITAYDVSTKEDTYSVDILSQTEDRFAKVQVFAGSKEIGDKQGNFSSAITDGQNDFTVKVTAQDGKTTKEYSIYVYRNEEDTMGLLTPVRAEDIDFERSDVIVVDITKYTRVAADVFNTLMEYPEKKIIFQGNDYSLQFNAADLGKIIPSTEIYDFAMSFKSPDEDRIYDKIRSKSGNKDLRRGDIVYVHFPHVGALPAPAVLNLSLGGKYEDETLYWHYFNEERNRIDYYGNVETNSKGTFALKIDHFSDYIITRYHRILGSEDKEGGALSTDLDYDEDGIDLSEEVEIDKVNPDTAGVNR